ncbi:MAG: sulfite exporter TauE/SafE family protein [bacterium]|nr:sulfite exporter TauE/SafE family protein [Gammaproteobacteria bacterium]HIL94696.1 sulfite exporter TauE/SafE family protein [Pseudomonadales bacterium]
MKIISYFIDDIINALMDYSSFYFLLLVALGAMVQTITGFAMGLIVMGGVTAMALADMGASAAVVGFISLVNALIALRHSHRLIDKDYLLWISVGLLPLILVGVWTLDYLSASYSGYLRMFLGFVIVSAGILLMLKPHPFSKPSSPFMSTLVGSIGGFISGLYGAGGAPLAFFMYRQPLDINIVRATLLAIFAVSTFSRTVTVALAGEIDREVLTLAGLSVPVVVLVTVGTSRVTGKLPDAMVRKCVFALLILLGLFLIVS